MMSIYLWLLLWVWLEFDRLLMASFWKWFCLKEWLCMYRSCIALSSCAKINKQHINSVTGIVIIPWLEWCCTILTLSSSIQGSNKHRTFLCSPCLNSCADRPIQEGELKSYVCKSRRHPAHLSNYKSSGFQVAMAQTVQVFTAHNPT